MAEAEDVLLEAAERAAAGAAALWARRRGAADADDVAVTAGRRRLGCWLAACFGGSFVLVETEAAPRPGWLARVWSGPAPWQRRPLAIAASDGRCLVLPRDSLVRLGASPDPAALLPALALAMRAAQGAGAVAPQPSPLERDVGWLLEAALVDAALARMLPGLGSPIAAARRQALRARPAPGALRPAERAVEELAVSLLEAPVADAPVEVERILHGRATRERVHAYARHFSASLPPPELRVYRGVAPVPHWGTWLAGTERRSAASTRADECGTQHRLAARRLVRRVARRPLDASDPEPRAGPFLLAPGDPKLSVQDPLGLGRPPDRGEEDLDALAEEVARQPELPTLTSELRVREILEDGARARSADAALPTRSGADPRAVAYPEWDCESRSYRLGACLLREGVPAAGSSDRSTPSMPGRASLFRQVRRQFEALRPRRVRTRRRLDGDGIDVDGWVEEIAERRARRAPGGRLYTQERPARRDGPSHCSSTRAARRTPGSRRRSA